MGFQIKDFETLKASMLNYIYFSDNELTDFNVGAVFRSLIESCAMEYEELYFRLWQGIQDSIQSSVTETFGFTPTAGTKAAGTVLFSRETAAPTDYLVPAGTQVISSAGIAYTTTADVTLLTGNLSVTASVLANEVGSSGNLSIVGAPLQIITQVTGISSATTASQLSGGADQETQDSVIQRFALYISSLVRGTAGAIKYGALTATASGGETVQDAQVIDNISTPGLVTVYIDNGSGAASVSLLESAQQIINGYQDTDGTYIDGYKAAGVLVSLAAVDRVNVDVHLEVYGSNDFTTVLKPAVETAIQNYFDELTFAQDVNWEKLIAVSFSAHPDILDIQLFAPSGSDIAIANGQKAYLNILDITEWVL